MMINYKLLVQPTGSCMETLRYLNKNIVSINNAGASIRVEKISNNDEETSEIFRKKGITRLPALIAPDGKLFVGLKQVTDLFEKNLRHGGNNTDGEIGTNPALANFWINELFDGEQQGRLIPRTDDEAGEADDMRDINRRMAQYERNIPSHRKGSHAPRAADDDYDDRPQQRRREKKARKRDDSDDEVDYDNNNRRRDRSPPRHYPNEDNIGEGNDDMDERMMGAWMNKNPIIDD